MEQTKNEELWNSRSHFVGVLFGLLGLIYLLVECNAENSYGSLSIWVYGISFILLFAVSTLYHAIEEPKLKGTFRKLDHICIYFLIAGTYTPVCLISLIGGNGWVLFASVWLISLIGLILKLFFTGRFEFISILLYLMMGWLIVLDGKNVLEVLIKEELSLMLLGGFFYTFGVVFYAMKKLKYQHVIWHFFVLGGAIAHYFMILSIVRA